VSAVDSSVKDSSTSLQSPDPSSSSILSSSTVEEPGQSLRAVLRASNASLSASSKADDRPEQPSTSDTVPSSVNVHTKEPVKVHPEPISPLAAGGRRPSGPILLDVKRQRARQREERMSQLYNRASNGNSEVLLAAKTNGTIANGINSTSSYPVTDDTANMDFPRKKYANHYDITAPDEHEKCCIVM